MLFVMLFGKKYCHDFAHTGTSNTALMTSQIRSHIKCFIQAYNILVKNLAQLTVLIRFYDDA